MKLKKYLHNKSKPNVEVPDGTVIRFSFKYSSISTVLYRYVAVYIADRDCWYLSGRFKGREANVMGKMNFLHMLLTDPGVVQYTLMIEDDIFFKLPKHSV